ncbi:hypothetical protein P885DRAFT_66381 [Corynascus similis CBS 632.67]
MSVIVNQILKARDAGPYPEVGKDSTAHGTSSRVAWIVTGVVAGVLVIGSALALFLVTYTRRQQIQRQQENDPFLTGYETFKRRKVSEAGLSQEDEERRAQLIRKSLAARSSRSSEISWASRSSASTAMLEEMDRDMEELERRVSMRLKDDWKKWEARIRHERTVSGEQHPAVSANINSAAPTVPILAVPTPSKHRSQGRMFSQIPPTPPVSPPPLPARHPARFYRT